MDFIINNGTLVKYTGKGGNVVIPTGVKMIGEDAFFQNYSITSVSIPLGVTRIKDGAFYQCECMQSITIPNTVTVIEENAFWGCTALTQIKLPESVKTIGEYAFCECAKLRQVEFSEGIIEIGEKAFNDCSSLKDLSLPSTLQRIGNDAFFACNGVTSVRIPADIHSIGGDAFMYCPSLTHVVVFGGVRSDTALSRMRKHFPNTVGMEWEGPGKPQTAALASQKSAAVPKRNDKKQGGFARYNDRIAFNLPKGYVFEDGVDDDGNHKASIGYTANANEDAETIIILNVQQPKEIPLGLSALDVIEKKNREATINRRVGGSPQGLLIVTTQDSNLHGMRFSISLVGLHIALSEREAFIMISAKVSSSEDDEGIRPILDHLKTLWGSMLIDDRKAIAGDLEWNNVAKISQKQLNAKVEAADTPLSVDVRQIGNTIEVGGRWCIELPFGMRHITVPRKTGEEYDLLEFALDRRTFGSCPLGDTVKQQRELAGIVDSMPYGMARDDDTPQRAFESTLRDDERIKVVLNLYFTNSGESKVIINIEEKASVSGSAAVKTGMWFDLPCKIDDLPGALQAVREGKLELEHHPFGNDWARYWQTIVRMAVSIAPIAEVIDPIEFSDPQILEGNVSVRFPVGFNPLKNKNKNTTVYMPTTNKPTQADLKHSRDFPYVIIQEVAKPDLPQGTERSMAGVLSIWARMICDGFEHSSHNIFSIISWESISNTAYKAI